MISGHEPLSLIENSVDDCSVTLIPEGVHAAEVARAYKLGDTQKPSEALEQALREMP
jgi:hypothetical protein